MKRLEAVVYKKQEQGQSAVFFALLVPFFVVAMIFAVDFGRFLVLQNQAQIFADGAASAAAGALDIRKFTTMNRSNVLNQPWATDRAQSVISDGVMLDDTLAGYTFSLSSIVFTGNEVTVRVTGSCPTLWSKPFGINGYVTTAVSSARAATGISKEIN